MSFKEIEREKSVRHMHNINNKERRFILFFYLILPHSLIRSPATCLKCGVQVYVSPQHCAHTFINRNGCIKYNNYVFRLVFIDTKSQKPSSNLSQ